MRYEKRVVLFLDILGFKDHIDKTIDKEGNDIEDEITKICTALPTLNKLVGVGWSKIITTQFSDSIVISFKTEGKNQFLNLLEIIIGLILDLIQHNIICRGAISYGKLIYNEDIIFGPAFVDAYITESKVAMYPRIILDSNILDIVEGDTKFYTDGRPQKEVLLSFLSEDEDGKYFIDYFEKCTKNMSLNELNSYIVNLRNIILDGFKKAESSYKNPDLKAKYGWMKTKFNKMVIKFTDDEFVSLFGADNEHTEIMKLRDLKKI
jgi:hypothetical protein